ncbi:MAG: MerR family transcriptional regulator [Agathobacter sp.]
MMTVHEVSKLTGVSIRTLHYYDEIGLLHPPVTTEAGYRMYDDTSLERLQSILLFKELEFPLKDIKRILDSPEFDQREALEQQIKLLTMKKEHIENLITFAKQIKLTGVNTMDFKAFDTKKIDEYTKQAREKWGNTEAYREFERKTSDYSDEKKKAVGMDLMGIFTEFGSMMDRNPEDERVQAQVGKLQQFITDNYYTCTKEILAGLGQMYAAGGEMTDNIDAAGGKGTAEFASRAIAIYCE